MYYFSVAAFLSRPFQCVNVLISFMSVWQCSYLVHFSVVTFLSRPFHCGIVLFLSISLWHCSYLVHFIEAVFLCCVVSFFSGRYEITEIPLPSSVIEQINKNNMKATLNPSHVTPTGVPTSATKNVQLPQALGPGEIT